MKRIYEFVTKANQVLLFIGLIALIVLIGFIIYDEFNNSGEPPHVVVTSSGADKPVGTEIKDVQFLGRSSDYFVFGVVKHVINGESSNGSSGTLTLAMARKQPKDSGEIVNVIFSRGDRVAKQLLPRDGLVLRHQLTYEYNDRKFSGMVFTCITEDSNADGRLDANDRNDLVIMDANLSNPEIVIKDCTDSDITSPTTLVVKTGSAANLRFIQVDIASGQQTEITWR